ncbi:MAG: terminase family protein [Hyphomicrobiales bacterium]|jgi:phage terminase large subunit-like protein
MSSATCLRTALIACAKAGASEDFTKRLSDHAVLRLCYDWDSWARPDQRPPLEAWSKWMLMGGRGCGKTRAGAEWVRGAIEGRARYAPERYGHLALVGETFADAREVMVEGVSGLRAIAPPWDRPRYEATRKRLIWENGAIAQLFSAEDPESLRGPQFDGAWCDEIGKWRYGEEAFDQLAFGLRVGAQPRCVITTTPRATPLVKRLMEDPNCIVSHATSQDNQAFLAEGFVQGLEQVYGGSRLYRQEVAGELIAERADSLWNRDVIDRTRLNAPPPLRRVVVAVDPPASSHAKSNACGIVACGMMENGDFAVLADHTCQAARPEQWAARAIDLFHRVEADLIVAEANQGGDMVRSVLEQASRDVPVKLVHAKRGKWLRAEPVAYLYAQSRVHHVGAFAALEDEMLDFGPEGLSAPGQSPDRLDALVWAISELMGGGNVPRLRKI